MPEAAATEIDEGLEKLVDHVAGLEAQAKALKEEVDAERGKIKARLEETGRLRYRTRRGREALLSIALVLAWDASKLLRLLDAEDLDELLPRSPAGAKLRKRYESDRRFAEQVRDAFTADEDKKLRVTEPKQ